ncbi:HET domain-containing protein [Fusarium falciforme]|uniref:HET domain-containing protein n=1 Tax=Fusarium falciforme TaxID=195108 RepID=UPI002300E99D|nr:HET domain-containing protein [Fusarium falciforme]WAO86145.1 HET domain-containing protein [Fusarium falciforme]
MEQITLNGKVVPIKGNLAYALRHVYEHWADAFPDERSRQMFLWADALCIDQDDVEEKSSQVPLMRTIFSRAELVMSWLGPESDSLHCAMDTIEMLYSEWSEKDDISDLRWILRHPSLCDAWTDERDDSWINTRWEAMYEFNRLSYWHCTWVFQEIVLAKRVRAICGRKALEWHKIAYVAEQASELNLELQTRGMMKPEFLSGPAWVALATRHSPPWILLQTYAEMGRMEASHEKAPHEPDWYLSVLGGRWLLATDPKDHIYGLLGVTRLPITPDYVRRRRLPLYCDYVANWLKAWRDGDIDFEELDFITFSGSSAAQKDPEMPSWISNCPSASSSEGVDGRLIYKGSASEQVFPKDTENASVIGMPLFVSGVELDIITQTEDCDYDGAFSVSNFDFLQEFVTMRPVYPTGISSLQAMFRILARGGYGGYEPLDATGFHMVTKWKSDDSIKWQTIEELCGCRGLAFFTTGSGYIGISRKCAQGCIRAATSMSRHAALLGYLTERLVTI